MAQFVEVHKLRGYPVQSSVRLSSKLNPVTMEWAIGFFNGQKPGPRGSLAREHSAELAPRN